MSNTFSYWNGQPVNAPVYPQMGDLMQHAAAGAASAAAAPPPPAAAGAAGAAGLGLGSGAGAGLGSWPGQGAAAAQTMLPFAGPASGMGSGMTQALPTFYGQGSNQFEPCIDNGEAFCAYNGMDMSMNYGGGSASKGGFW
ncbi:alanine and glycine-rich protein [Drosophila erecta]|uniref:alanine and glycine-rich protein n=1 Tax=Drosophila erecta TaxID=7220 RepID=UPI00017811FD|nr:alanine and glycine-rich protein [Drosophila erecta]